MSNLVNQPTAAPTRKLKFGIVGGALVVGLVAAINAYDPTLGSVVGPIIFSIAGALGVAIPAYLTKNAR